MTLSKLPRLELTEDPNNKNDYIIYRDSIKGKKIKHNKTVTKKRTKHRKTKKRSGRKSRKGFFNIF